MLLIWDIHIHPRHGDFIIQMLRDFISQNNHEQHLIFVGDYVYHFSYHRPSLLALLDLFLELTKQWKVLYILAWNHDRLGKHFVYAEAEKIINRENREDRGDDMSLWHHTISNTLSKIYFITTPQIIRIESEDVFFLPYILSWKDSEELNQYINDMILEWQKNSLSSNTTIQVWDHITISPKLTVIT